MDRRQYEIREEKLAELGFAKYQEYLNGEAWATRRWIYEHEYPKRCSWCGIDHGIHLHHRSYVNLGHELDEDLTWLCGKHHFEVHATGRWPEPSTEQQIEILEDLNWRGSEIKRISRYEADQIIRHEQNRLLRQQFRDDDWLDGDGDTDAWLRRNA